MCRDLDVEFVTQFLNQKKKSTSTYRIINPRHIRICMIDMTINKRGKIWKREKI